MSKTKMSIKVEKAKLRSMEALDAKMRRAPRMDHRLEPRGGSRNWRSLADD